jgi:hypothetical protein
LIQKIKALVKQAMHANPVRMNELETSQNIKQLAKTEVRDNRTHTATRMQKQPEAEKCCMLTDIFHE